MISLAYGIKDLEHVLEMRDREKMGMGRCYRPSAVLEKEEPSMLSVVWPVK